MATERERMRLERAVQARTSTGITLNPADVRDIEFVAERPDGQTEWLLPATPEPDAQVEALVLLGPADVMRYGLQEKMRDAILTGRHAQPAGEPPVDRSVPDARLGDPQIQEGRTDDGWRWSMVHDDEGAEWLVAIDNKPAVEAHDDKTTHPPAMWNAVVPLDVLEAVVRGV